MRTRITATLAAMLLGVGLLAAPAAASGHGDGPPPHGHVLLLHATWTGSGPATQVSSYAKCIDLANGQVIPAHHDTIHTGPAGDALKRVGHLVMPTFGGWDCADFEEILDPTPRGKGR